MACQLLGHEQGLVCGFVRHLPEISGHGKQVSVGVRQAVHWYETGAVHFHVIGQAAHCLLRHQSVALLTPEAFPTVRIHEDGIRARSGARIWHPSAAQEGLLQRAFGRALNPRVDHNRVHFPKLGEALQHVWSVDFKVFLQTVFRQPLDQRCVPLRSVFQGIRAPLLPAHAAGAVGAYSVAGCALQGVHFVGTQMPVHGSDPVEVVPVHDDGRHIEAVERIKELLHPHIRPVKVLGREDNALALRPCSAERDGKVSPPLLHLGVVALERTNTRLQHRAFDNRRILRALQSHPGSAAHGTWPVPPARSSSPSCGVPREGWLSAWDSPSVRAASRRHVCVQVRQTHQAAAARAVQQRPAAARRPSTAGAPRGQTSWPKNLPNSSGIPANREDNQPVCVARFPPSSQPTLATRGQPASSATRSARHRQPRRSAAASLAPAH
eukprot:scaffold34763_cov82-Phaeocystis_antarctica.AAC.11